MAQVSASGAFAQVSEAGDRSLGDIEQSSQLLESLDSLLEQYLQLLHRHQALHTELGKQLSSGFFSLAQANYSSSGRRYGQDYYDERMKATRRILVEPSAADVDHDNPSSELERAENTGSFSQSHIFKIETTLVDYETKEDRPKPETAASEENVESSDSTSNPGPSATIENQTEVPAAPEESKEGTTYKSSSPEPPRKGLPSPDPLRWYGVLVPPSLRSAQRSFISATESVPELASITTAMRNVEERVSELRYRLGLS